MAARQRWKPVPVIAVVILVLGLLGWLALSCLRRDDLAEAAAREGVVEIWSTTDRDRVGELLADFRRLHPRIRVVYTDLHGSDLQMAFLRSARQGSGTADLLWSSAMDLQIKLVNDGYATTYSSSEAGDLPDWAKWKDQAWGVTAEPIVIVYNKRLIAADNVPDSHLSLRRYLESDITLEHRTVATYDPKQSAVGYLYLSQDAQASGEVWRLVQAMSSGKLALYTSAEDILRDVSSGRAAIGYNIAGSYALDEMAHEPDLGVIMPQDYTLVMSRIAMIPSEARHPAAARLFLDFLLSRAGQERLSRRHITPARVDATLPLPLRTPSVSLRAIRVGPGLLVSGDQLTREHFLGQWNAAIQNAGSQRPKLPPSHEPPH